MIAFDRDDTSIPFAYFEEAVGPLCELIEQEGFLIAQIGQVRLALPSYLERDLRPLIGFRLAILRTDIPGKNYLFRNIDEDSNCKEKATSSEVCAPI